MPGRPTVLVTGFEPFRQYRVNSSWEGVRTAGRRRSSLHTALLPVDHRAAHRLLQQQLGELQPDILLLCGLAPGPGLRLERLARKPQQLAAVPGCQRRLGKWPWAQAIQHLHNSGFSASFSRDAGSYVCESSYWSALNFRIRHGYPRRVALLHVPPLSRQWTADRIASAILVLIDTAVAEPQPVAATGA